MEGKGTNLSGGLVHTQLMPQFLLTDRSWRVNLVAEDKEGDHVQAFNGH